MPAGFAARVDARGKKVEEDEFWVLDLSNRKMELPKARLRRLWVEQAGPRRRWKGETVRV